MHKTRAIPLSLEFLKAPLIPPNTVGVVYDEEGYGSDSHAPYPSFYIADLLTHYFPWEALKDVLRWDLSVLRTSYSRHEYDDDRNDYDSGNLCDDDSDTELFPKLPPIAYRANAHGLLPSAIVSYDNFFFGIVSLKICLRRFLSSRRAAFYGN
jgi:hypothetical protein